MNNEPVAWMLTLPDGTHDWILEGNGCEGYIPLYTHPVKELTADEIHEVAKQFLQSYDLESNYGLYEETSSVLVAFEDWYGFARAILRKASEK